MEPDAEIDALILEALESAGISGLCREGCLELAVDRLRRSHPEIDGALAWTLVNAVSERMDKKSGRGD
jgi:hypothetical protein